MRAGRVILKAEGAKHQQPLTEERKGKGSTYLSTCATVFGPYHWPMDFPSPTPIWAAAQQKTRTESITSSTLHPFLTKLYLIGKSSHLETLLNQQYSVFRGGEKDILKDCTANPFSKVQQHRSSKGSVASEEALITKPPL